MAKELLKIENVYFVYTSIAEPTYKFESKIEKEFKTTIVVSKEQAKDFKKLKLNKTVKEVDTATFEEKYKFKPPYPEQEEQFLIAVSKRATYKDGNPTPDWTYPKTYFQKNEGAEIIESSSTLIGNGSFGDIRLEPSYNEKARSTNISLHSILVKNLVPFEKKGDEWAAPPRPSNQEVVNDELPF